MASTDVLDPPGTAAVPLPRLAPGTELLGRFQDTAYQDPRYLLRRSDGQVMQLPGLLYRVAASLDGRDAAALAAELSAEFDRELTADQVVYLVEDRLRPVGVVADDPAAVAAPPAAGSAGAAPAPPPVRADPLLALRHRVAVLPASAAQRVGRLFGPLFLRPVWVLVVAAFLTGAVWIAVHDVVGGLVAGVQQMALQPVFVLAILGLTVVGAAFHECGHVAACSYGGARPGNLGVGLYVLWPAFYSTVTDSYRLGRVGRVRTDLGGIYFNVVFMVGVEAVYLATGTPWLLIALVGMLAQTAWQFLPSLRLDGYYILADLVGVPELFGFVKPALLSALPWRPTHPGVQALKPAARRWVQAWVLVVVPTIAFWTVVFLVALPRLVPAAITAATEYLQRLDAAARAGDVVATTLGVFQLLVLALPWVGLLLILGPLGRLLGRVLLRGRTLGAPARQVLRRVATATGLTVLGAAVVARTGWLALTVPATDAETRLVGSAVAGARHVPGPAVGPDEWLARWQLIGWDRWTSAFTRHASPVTGARELAVLACAVLVTTALVLAAARRLQVRAVALSLAAVGAMGPAVTELARIGPGVVGAAWVAVGAVVLGSVRRAPGTLLGLLAVVAGVVTAPVAGVLLALGLGLPLLSRTRPEGRHADPPAGIGRHRRPRSVSPVADRWTSVLVVVPAAVLAAGAPGAGVTPPGAGPDGLLLALVAAVVLVAGLLLPGVRALAAGALAVVAAAALPWAGAGAVVPVAVAAVALLAAVVVDRTTGTGRGRPPHPLLRAAVAVPVLCLVLAGALFVPAAEPVLPHRDLAAWLTGPGAVGSVVVPAALWGELVGDGVVPQRLVVPGDPGAAAAEWQVVIGDPPPGTAVEHTAGHGARALTVTRTPGARLRLAAAAEQRTARASVGGLIVASPRLWAPADVLATFARGGVDPRASAVLAHLLTAHTVVLGGFPTPPDRDGLRGSLLLTGVDGGTATAAGVTAALDRQAAGPGGLRPDAAVAVPGGVVLSWTAPAPASAGA